MGLERTFLDRSGYVPEVGLFFGMQIKNNDSNIGNFKYDQALWLIGLRGVI